MFLSAMALVAVACLQVATAQVPPFSWDRATIYTLGTAGSAPGAATTSTSTASDAGRAFSSDDTGSATLASVEGSLEEGYFSELGVDVLSLPVPFSLPGRLSEIFPFDYSAIRADLGSKADLRRLVERAHAAGMRVLAAIQLPSTTIPVRIDSTGANAAIDLESLAADVWGPETETRIRSLKSFYERTASSLNNMSTSVALLCEFVGTTGLDGYRVVNTDALDPSVSSLLKSECAAARRTWAETSGESDAADFWLIGESRDQGLERTDAFDAGFDALVATDVDAFPSADSAFAAYSQTIESDSEVRVISSMNSGPSHLFDRGDPASVAMHLMLMPGPIEIGVGTEMEGASIPEHWSIPASFRMRHPAVAGGVHIKLDADPYTFYRGLRLGARMDEVIVVMGASGKTRVNVTKAFPDDTVLRDASTGSIAIVSFGEVEFQAGENGVLLLEPVQ